MNRRWSCVRARRSARFRCSSSACRPCAGRSPCSSSSTRPRRGKWVPFSFQPETFSRTQHHRVERLVPRKQKRAAQSKTFNKECLLFNFYDFHDVWHFLSAVSLFFSFVVRCSSFLSIAQSTRTRLRKKVSFDFVCISFRRHFLPFLTMNGQNVLEFRQILLTLDDDLLYTPRDKIPVFWNAIPTNLVVALFAATCLCFFVNRRWDDVALSQPGT